MGREVGIEQQPTESEWDWVIDSEVGWGEEVNGEREVRWDWVFDSEAGWGKRCGV